MIAAWLELPVWQMFVALAVGFGVSASLIYAWAFSRWTRTAALTFAGLVPSYFSAVATLLALLTGFVASDTWERQKQAARVLQSEGDGVLTLYDLSIASAPDMSAIRATLNAYVDASITDEWAAMGNASSSPAAAAALARLLEQIAVPRIAAEAGAPTQAALLTAALKLRSDRGTRLALNLHHTDTSKWLALIILGLLTQLSIAVVHLDRPRAHAAAQAIFSLALISSLGLIAEHEWPFDGPDALKPRELIAAKAVIAPARAAAPAIGSP